MLSFGVALNAPRKFDLIVNIDFLIGRYAKKLFNSEFNSYSISADMIITLEFFK